MQEFTFNLDKTMDNEIRKNERNEGIGIFLEVMTYLLYFSEILNVFFLSRLLFSFTYALGE